MNLEKLKEPFAEKDIEWRVGNSDITNGKVWATALAYVTARAGQDRLDEVVGPGNWQDHYEFVAGGVLCTISIKIGDEWVQKQNGSQETKIESFKGGISGAFKRAASNWGIGRYLYDLPHTYFEITSERTGCAAKLADEKWHNLIPPKLPDWALPSKKETSNTQQDRPVSAAKNDPIKSNGKAAPLNSLRIFYGKHEGKLVCELSAYDLKGQIKYWDDEAKKGKPLTGKLLEIVKEMRMRLADIENDDFTLRG